jgi:hypothetical protein
MPSRGRMRAAGALSESPGGGGTRAVSSASAVTPAVWSAKPGDEHVCSQADCSCAFWEREAGID